MVGADSLATVLEELLHVDLDWQALELAAALGELIDPLGGAGGGRPTLRLSFNGRTLLITNRVA